MEKNTIAFIKLLRCDESGELEFRSYSGRSMYGEECLGITGRVGDIFKTLMTLALENADSISEDDREEILDALSQGAEIDAMGRNSVVYFPGVKFTRQDGVDASFIEE